MDIKKLDEILQYSLANTSDDKKAADYSNAVCQFLEEEKASNELISIIVKGMDIDRGANFFDYIESLSKDSLQEIWKIIRNNTEVKRSSPNAIKFLCGMLYTAFVSEKDITLIRGSVISFLTGLINKGSIKESVYTPIVLDYFVQDLPDGFTYPTWDSLKITPGVEKVFIKIMLYILTKNEIVNRNHLLRQWIKNGEQHAEKELHKKQLEDKIPPSKIGDLKSLIEHYTKVEQNFRTLVYDMDKKEIEVAMLSNQILELTKQRDSLEVTIRDSERTLEKMQEQLAGAKKEVEQRKEINDAFDALKKNEENAILNDIANGLKAEYRDFMDSEKDEMDIDLGEIYREKIKNIFRILKKKGIQVE